MADGEVGAGVGAGTGGVGGTGGTGAAGGEVGLAGVDGGAAVPSPLAD